MVLQSNLNNFKITWASIIYTENCQMTVFRREHLVIRSKHYSQVAIQNLTKKKYTSPVTLVAYTLDKKLP